MKFRVVNLTGHDIHVSSGGVDITYPRSSDPLRLVHRLETIETDINDVNVVRSNFVHDEELVPEMKGGIRYLVPKLISDIYAGERDDFISPGTNVLFDEPEFAYAEDGSRRVKSVKQFRLPSRLIRI